MRFKLYFELENEIISIQYRKSILSFIKKSLKQYDEEKFERFYHGKANIMKPFSFSVFLKDSNFEGDYIIVNSKILEVNFCTSDYNAGIILYNSFRCQKDEKFSLNQNSMTLRKMILLPEKEIKEEQIRIKFMAPLVVRKRENQKDMYYSYENENFLDTLKLNIKIQLQISDLPEEIVQSFHIEPIKAKKIIVKFYEKKIETSIGTFKLSGEKKLLNYLYQTGMGSKHSAGFGMFEVI